MPLDYTSPSLSLENAEPNGPLLIQYPYAQYGDLVTRFARQAYMQLWGDYAAPALSSIITSGASSLYCVGDDIPVDAGAGLCSFTRSWYAIPASRSVPSGTYAYTFPGLPSGTVGTAKTITAMDPDEGDVSNVESPTFTSTAHGFIVGQKLRLSLTYSGGVTRTPLVTVIAQTTNTFTTTDVFLFSGSNNGGFTLGTWSSGTATAFATSRNAKTIITDTVEVFSYALPGVTAGVSVAGDFRRDPSFEPFVTATGEEVAMLTSITTPTDSAYRAMVEAGEYIVLESGIGRLAGEILERKTLLGRAS